MTSLDGNYALILSQIFLTQYDYDIINSEIFHEYEGGVDLLMPLLSAPLDLIEAWQDINDKPDSVPSNFAGTGTYWRYVSYRGKIIGWLINDKLYKKNGIWRVKNYLGDFRDINIQQAKVTFIPIN